MSDLQHSFVSAEGRSASYNNVNRESKRVQFFKDFIFHNPNIGGRFQRSRSVASQEGGTDEGVIEEGEEEEDEEEEEEDEEDASGTKDDEKEETSDKSRHDLPGQSTMHELSRQKLIFGYFNHEVYSEMEERNHIESVIFGPKTEPDNPDVKVSFQQSVLAYMEEVICLFCWRCFSSCAFHSL